MKSRMACCFSVSMSSVIPDICLVRQYHRRAHRPVPHAQKRPIACSYRRGMETERGAALILALMILCFLAVVAGALLTTTTIVIWVGDNYKVGTQLVYLAEAGIEEAREALGASPFSASQLLATASGADGVLSGSRDLPTLLGKT